MRYLIITLILLIAGIATAQNTPLEEFRSANVVYDTLDATTHVGLSKGISGYYAFTYGVNYRELLNKSFTITINGKSVNIWEWRLLEAEVLRLNPQMKGNINYIPRKGKLILPKPASMKQYSQKLKEDQEHIIGLKEQVRDYYESLVAANGRAKRAEKALEKALNVNNNLVSLLTSEPEEDWTLVAGIRSVNDYKDADAMLRYRYRHLWNEHTLLLRAGTLDGNKTTQQASAMLTTNLGRFPVTFSADALRSSQNGRDVVELVNFSGNIAYDFTAETEKVQHTIRTGILAKHYGEGNENLYPDRPSAAEAQIFWQLDAKPETTTEWERHVKKEDMASSFNNMTFGMGMRRYNGEQASKQPDWWGIVAAGYQLDQVSGIINANRAAGIGIKDYYPMLQADQGILFILQQNRGGALDYTDAHYTSLFTGMSIHASTFEANIGLEKNSWKAMISLQGAKTATEKAINYTVDLTPPVSKHFSVTLRYQNIAEQDVYGLRVQLSL